MFGEFKNGDNFILRREYFVGIYSDNTELATLQPVGKRGQFAHVASTGTVWYWNTDTSAWTDSLVAFTSVVPAGTNTQILFNDSGSFGANAKLTFDKATGVLGVNSTVFSASPDAMAHTPYRRYWDDENKCFAYDHPDGGVIQEQQEPFDIYVNLEGADIVNGDIVSVVGASGNRTAVALTDATSATLPLSCIGMCTVSTIANNNRGRITKNGKVRGLNTLGMTEGAPVYVDPLNKGKLTQTKPDAPNYIIYVGVVDVAHGTEGIIDVDIRVNCKLSDLSDVNGTPLTANGQLMVWDNDNGYFDFSHNINDKQDASPKVKLTAEGGIAVKLTNKTGGVSVKGTVVSVYRATAIDNAIRKIVVDEPDPIGVIYEAGIADGSEVWVVISGVAEVLFVGNTTRGHLARGFITADGASYEAGKALSEAIPSSPFATDKHFYEIGHVLASRTGAGLAKVCLHFN